MKQAGIHVGKINVCKREDVRASPSLTSFPTTVLYVSTRWGEVSRGDDSAADAHCARRYDGGTALGTLIGAKNATTILRFIETFVPLPNAALHDEVAKDEL